jgi:hypothetical protein
MHIRDTRCAILVSADKSFEKYDLEISKNIINVFCENPGQYGSF